MTRSLIDGGDDRDVTRAIYLWNQPAAENNHTPAWDDFGIVQ